MFNNMNISLFKYYQLSKRTGSVSDRRNIFLDYFVGSLINFPRLVYIRISLIFRHLITGTRWYSVPSSFSLFPPVHVAAPPSSIYVSPGSPFLFVPGEMIDRTENRWRRDS